jgi:hypothetical protein
LLIDFKRVFDEAPHSCVQAAFEKSNTGRVLNNNNNEKKKKHLFSLREMGYKKTSKVDVVPNKGKVQ